LGGERKKSESKPLLLIPSFFGAKSFGVDADVAANLLRTMDYLRCKSRVFHADMQADYASMERRSPPIVIIAARRA